jgi:hypothetical protein
MRKASLSEILANKSLWGEDVSRFEQAIKRAMRDTV